VKFEALRVVTKKITVFWDVMPSSLVDVYQCLGGMCCLHLQGRRVVVTNEQVEEIFTYKNFTIGFS
jgi:hypothetical protein